MKCSCVLTSILRRTPDTGSNVVVNRYTSVNRPLPEDHWTKLPSTNVLEQLNREFGTRTRLVGIFPSETLLLRFVTALLMEIDDDWQVDKRYMAERSMTAARAERPPLLAPAAQLIG